MKNYYHDVKLIIQAAWKVAQLSGKIDVFTGSIKITLFVVCLFSIFRPHGRQCLLLWWLRPCYFLTRFTGQFSNDMIAFSIAPALFQPVPEALYSFDV
ncbi:BgTH12-03281 [Blumeria graminis f. sp. triticale]|uniref:Bgt-50794 n=4 Tax=Blumeria graminis TaxID=34373 RepID=A0A9X9MJ88_BLUGR|nr:BgTH12-03281 [Blumeria graminis f. sp. triticale]VDB89781.1 Bgt-50794 [Blumeria graminis f. sp. tritici]